MFVLKPTFQGASFRHNNRLTKDKNVIPTLIGFIVFDGFSYHEDIKICNLRKLLLPYQIITLTLKQIKLKHHLEPFRGEYTNVEVLI